MRPARARQRGPTRRAGPDVLALVATAGADAVAVGVTEANCKEGVLDLGKRGRVGLRRQVREQAESIKTSALIVADAGRSVARGSGAVFCELLLMVLLAVLIADLRRSFGRREKLRRMGAIPQVRAAGGLVVRERDGEPQVAVIHRPRYDDWSLPKGKLHPGEDWEAGALRGVARRPASTASSRMGSKGTTYLDPQGPPQARPLLAHAAASRQVRPREPDDLRWLTPAEAADLLTYEHDRELVGALGGG